jgi:transcriptional regulator with XRE-family HTH domain
MKNLKNMTNKAISLEIGERIEQMRLEQNLTQQQLADEIGLSRPSYRKLEAGSAKFENIIATLRVLGRLDLIESFIPETPFSPLEQLKLQGKKRQRASRKRSVKYDKSSSNIEGNRVNEPKPDLGW